MPNSQPDQGLATPVRFVRGVGESRAVLLGKLNIHTVGHLLLTLPRRYEDRRKLSTASDLRSLEFATVAVEVREAGWRQPRFGRGYFEALCNDATGLVRAQWFGARYLQETIKAGDRLLLFGKVRTFRGEPVLAHPEIERANEDAEDSLHTGRIVPVYPLTEGLSQRVLRRIAWNAVEQFVPQVREILPPETIERRGLPPLADALRTVHFPTSLNDSRAARERLAFDEFLCMQYVLVARRAKATRIVKPFVHRPAGKLRAAFLASLPFQLTGAQQRVLVEIREDMARTAPMHRLLQGDVGSGKTVVAACALLDVVEGGGQGAVMAPTEILAAQHFRTFSRYLAPLGIRVELLKGDLTAAEKVAIRASIADGRTQIVVGTHALIQDRVVFKRLGLVVIDEQHKFGVEQRGVLYDKGAHPDVLVMTATPIPRTLAMTLYGDLDVSVIDELPAGRQAIVTKAIGEAQLEKAYDFIRGQIAKGRQAYIVYPLVNESELVELKSATEMYDNLRMTAFAGLRMGLLHGQLKPDAKDAVMQKFRAGELDVLVATTVVEVGVDVPNATVMLVENAEQFGLAQLHQLRGRIGRGAHKSYCILQGHPKSREAWKRLKVMTETNDGFKIAEEDFRIRGMGNLLGREQSGMPVLRVADPLADVRLLELARQEATLLVEADSSFSNPVYEPLRTRARDLFREVGGYVKVG
jgi:ATP-dependent DNA helicase RecG